MAAEALEAPDTNAEDTAWRSNLALFYDRLSRAAEKNSGINLSATEVDLIVLTGAFGAIAEALSSHQREQARARLAARE